jgi:superfamily I DNA/RNA helicase
MTRAMSSLTLTYAASRTRWARVVENAPSRFLKDLPEECVEFVDRGSPPDRLEEERIAESYLTRIRDRL